MALNSLDDPKGVFVKGVFNRCGVLPFLILGKFKSVYWIVVEKILPPIYTTEIVSYPDCERTRMKAFLKPYQQ